MLMDVCSKIFSSVMNSHAFCLLNENGTRFQFGGTPKLGCCDGLFVLKTLLTMRKNHSLQSYVAFVDLIKAYDTASHILLLNLLEKHGAPPSFISAVERTYQDLTYCSENQDQSTGNPPISWSLTRGYYGPGSITLHHVLEVEWKNAGITVCMVQSIVGDR
jgi:hypothetical protein